MDKYLLFDGNDSQIAENKNHEQKPVVKEEKKQATPSASSEAKDKAYKNKNKARFGNHNRKANRDKKIAKTAPPPS